MHRRVLAAQNISRMCMVCGTDNQAGLHTRFYELEGGELLGVFEPREIHQGYPGRLHGGVASPAFREEPFGANSGRNARKRRGPGASDEAPGPRLPS